MTAQVIPFRRKSSEVENLFDMATYLAVLGGIMGAIILIAWIEILIEDHKR